MRILERVKKTKKRKYFCKWYTYLFNYKEPQTYLDAISFGNAPFWKEPTKTKIDFVTQNINWVLVDLSYWAKPIGYKGIFKISLNVVVQ